MPKFFSKPNKFISLLVSVLFTLNSVSYSAPVSAAALRGMASSEHAAVLLERDLASPVTSLDIAREETPSAQVQAELTPREIEDIVNTLASLRENMEELIRSVDAGENDVLDSFGENQQRWSGIIDDIYGQLEKTGIDLSDVEKPKKLATDHRGKTIFREGKDEAFSMLRKYANQVLLFADMAEHALPEDDTLISTTSSPSAAKIKDAAIKALQELSVEDLELLTSLYGSPQLYEQAEKTARRMGPQDPGYQSLYERYQNALSRLGEILENLGVASYPRSIFSFVFIFRKATSLGFPMIRGIGGLDTLRRALDMRKAGADALLTATIGNERTRKRYNYLSAESRNDVEANIYGEPVKAVFVGLMCADLIHNAKESDLLPGMEKNSLKLAGDAPGSIATEAQVEGYIDSRPPEVQAELRDYTKLQSGGPPTSAARVCAQLAGRENIRIDEITSVGKNAQPFIRSQEALGINMSNSHISETRPTAYTLIFELGQGNRGFLHNYGASAELTIGKLRPEYFIGKRVAEFDLELTALMKDADKALKMAKDAGCITVWDTVKDNPHQWREFSKIHGRYYLRHLLSLIDVFTPSIEEAQQIMYDYVSLYRDFGYRIIDNPKDITPEELVSFFAALGAKAIFLKAGKQGVYVKTSKDSVFKKEASFHIPIFKGFREVGNTGTGDAFTGAVVYALCRGWDAVKTAMFADVVGGMCVQYKGGTIGEESLIDALYYMERLRAQMMAEAYLEPKTREAAAKLLAELKENKDSRFVYQVEKEIANLLYLKAFPHTTSLAPEDFEMPDFGLENFDAKGLFLEVVSILNMGGGMGLTCKVLENKPNRPVKENQLLIEHMHKSVVVFKKDLPKTTRIPGYTYIKERVPHFKGIEDYNADGSPAGIKYSDDDYSIFLADSDSSVVPEEYRKYIVEEIEGKSETFIAVQGEGVLLTDDAIVKYAPKGFDPKHIPIEWQKRITLLKESYGENITTKGVIYMKAGTVVLLPKGTLHAFLAGDEGAVYIEFSSPSLDPADDFTDPNVDRMPKKVDLKDYNVPTTSIVGLYSGIPAAEPKAKEKIEPDGLNALIAKAIPLLPEFPEEMIVSERFGRESPADFKAVGQLSLTVIDYDIGKGRGHRGRIIGNLAHQYTPVQSHKAPVLLKCLYGSRVIFAEDITIGRTPDPAFNPYDMPAELKASLKDAIRKLGVTKEHMGLRPIYVVPGVELLIPPGKNYASFSGDNGFLALESSCPDIPNLKAAASMPLVASSPSASKVADTFDGLTFADCRYGKLSDLIKNGQLTVERLWQMYEWVKQKTAELKKQQHTAGPDDRSKVLQSVSDGEYARSVIETVLYVHDPDRYEREIRQPAREAKTASSPSATKIMALGRGDDIDARIAALEGISQSNASFADRSRASYLAGQLRRVASDPDFNLTQREIALIHSMTDDKIGTASSPSAAKVTSTKVDVTRYAGKTGLNWHLGIDSSTQSVKFQVIDWNTKEIIWTHREEFDTPKYQRLFNAPGGVVPHPQAPEQFHTSPFMIAAALENGMAQLSRDFKKNNWLLSNLRTISGAGQQHGIVAWSRTRGTKALRQINEDVSVKGKRGQSSGMMWTQLRALGAFSRNTASIWMDGTAKIRPKREGGTMLPSVVDKIDEAAGGSQATRDLTGSSATPRFSLDTIMMYRETDLASYNETGTFSNIAAFNGALLTGNVRFPIDPTDGAGMNMMNIHTNTWATGLIKKVAPGLTSKLPPIKPSADIVGLISNYWVKKYGFSPNTCIVNWRGDNPSSQVGMGIVEEGEWAVSLGTSYTIFGYITKEGLDKALSVQIGHVFGEPVNGEHMLLACVQNGAKSLERIRDKYIDAKEAKKRLADDGNTSPTDAEIDDMKWQIFEEEVAKAPVGNNGAMMLPQHKTEDVVYIPFIEGTKLFMRNLDENNRPQALRAAIEGQAYFLKWIAKQIGVDVKKIKLTAGGSKSKTMRRILADMFGARIDVLKVTDSTPLGSALIGAYAYLNKRGISVSPQDLVKGFTEVDEAAATEPIKDNVTIFERRFKEFESMLGEAIAAGKEFQAAATKCAATSSPSAAKVKPRPELYMLDRAYKMIEGSQRELNENWYAIFEKQGEKVLAIYSPTADAFVDAKTIGRFDGRLNTNVYGYTLICPLTHKNASALREVFPFTTPSLLGTKPAFGMGYRWSQGGNAIQARVAKELNATAMLAQQSEREITRTKRSFQEVLDLATWSAFEAGLDIPWGADADHLKTEQAVQQAVDAGFTYFTYDPSDYIQNKVGGIEVEKLQGTALKDAFINAVKNPFEREAIIVRYRHNHTAMAVGLEPTDDDIMRLAVKYYPALKRAAELYALTKHLKKVARTPDFDAELSVDETETETTPLALIFISEELKNMGVELQAIAPRFVGNFEKGVDYFTGVTPDGRKLTDTAEFRQKLAEIVAIARAYGFKLSVHSGSDKFSVYPILAELTQGLLHAKTAGTAYLEELRVVAFCDPALLMEIYDFSLQQFQKDRATYHLSAINLDRIPDLKKLTGVQIYRLLESGRGNDDLRQVLHVTYGSVLTHPEFSRKIAEVLKANPHLHYEILGNHLKKHIELLGLENSAQAIPAFSPSAGKVFSDFRAWGDMEDSSSPPGRPTDVDPKETSLGVQASIATATAKGIRLFVEKKRMIIEKAEAALEAEQALPPDKQDADKIREATESIKKALKAISEVEAGLVTERVETQNRLAMAPLNQAIRRLADNGYQDVAKILIDLYPIALPYFIKGQDESPVHHIAHVVNFMTEIAIGEKISRDDVKRLVIAALLHDIGVGDAILPKITENMVRNEQDPVKRNKLRKKAVESRKEHMVLGEGLSLKILNGYNTIYGGNAFTKADIEAIKRIVAKHDNSKIPLMLVGEYGDSAIPPDVIEECKTYLITSDREGEDWLMQLHWEADALWMLSSDGLLVDLQRQKEEDTPQNRLAKLHFNLGLHREVVGKVYANVYSRTEFEKFGFHDGLLYRSATGYGIAERLVREGELLVAPSPSAAKVTSKETLSMIAKSRLLVKDIENGDYFSLLDAMNEWGLDNFDSYETILVLIKRGFAREVSIEELRKEGVLRKRDERYKDNIYFRLSANGKGALVRAINEIQTVPTIPAFSPSAAKINDSAEPTTPYLLQALDAAA